MTLRPAPSTLPPLPRKRQRADPRPAIALASVNGTSTRTDNSGLMPENTTQNNTAPLTRRKAIQTNETSSNIRQDKLERINALRIEVRTLVSEIAHAADLELLDLMADEVGSFTRHKAAQEARTWATTAGITLETGLMQLDRAIPIA